MNDISPDTDERYSPVEGDPYMVQTAGGIFGGPEDVASGQDDGKFYFGGGSVLPDGSINPEHYAAFPKELYNAGIVHPGQIVKVVNPENNEPVMVVARDVGPSAPGRGIDLAPHVGHMIGYETGKPLLIDFRPHGIAPHADLAASGAKPFIYHHPDLAVPVSGPLVPGAPDVKSLTPIGSGGPSFVSDEDQSGGSDEPALPDPTMGDTDSADYDRMVSAQTDALDAQRESADEGVVPTEGKAKSGAPTQLVMPGDNMQIVGRNANGGVELKSGLVIYDDHIERPMAGRLYAQYPGQYPTNVSPDSGVLAQGRKLGISPYENGKPLSMQQYEQKVADAMKGSQGVDVPPGVHGEEALQGLPETEKALVRSLANYDMNPASLGRSQDRIKLLSRAALYDPTYNVAKFDQRKRYLMEMASRRPGTVGGAKTGLNQAIEHLHALNGIADKLNNGDIVLANGVGNMIQQQLGKKPEVDQFNTIRHTLATELERSFTGGVPNVSGVQEWQNRLNAAKSKAQLKGVIQEAIPTLMGGALNALSDQYGDIMGKPPTEPFLQSRSRNLLKDMGVDPDELEGTGKEDGEGSSAAKAHKLNVGDIIPIKGRTDARARYKGGDPDLDSSYDIIKVPEGE